MRAIASGDCEAFSRLYDILAVATYSIFRRHLSVQEEADGAMRAMWIDVWRDAIALSRAPGTTSQKIIAAAEARAHSRVTSAV